MALTDCQRDYDSLTIINPGTIINPEDILFCEVTKSKYNEDVGLKITERNGKLWIKRVREDGLFKKFDIPIEAGDQILKVNGQNANANANANAIGDGFGLKDIRRIFKQESHIELMLCRAQRGLHD